MKETRLDLERRLRILPALLFALAGCSGSTKPKDTTPPAAVTDLSATAESPTSILLRWHAPGDDGASGRAARYDIRSALHSINEGNWLEAEPLAGVPTPADAQKPESLLVSGLGPEKRVYFALRSADEAGNLSGLSRVADAVTPAARDTIPPAAVRTLAFLSSTSTTITVTWQAVGDDSSSGRAAAYDVRYSLTPLDGANWETATPAVEVPEPRPAGVAESCTILGLRTDADYFIALRVRDEAGNLSPLSNVLEARTKRVSDRPGGRRAQL